MVSKITNPPTQKDLIDKVNEVIDNIYDFYGTCSTKNTTQAKVVVCPEFVLKEGVSIRVKFTNAQSYNGAPTLNVNGTGAITVQSKSGTNGVRYCWLAGEVVAFTYDGTNYIMEDGGIASTSYYGITALTESATSTSSTRALTPSSLNNLCLYMISGYPLYSSSSTYNVGDRVRYTWQTWECNTAITTAESWNAEHWTALDSLQVQINAKQDTLVSGTNIKTINNQSILGSGNINIQGGGIETVEFLDYGTIDFENGVELQDGYRFPVTMTVANFNALVSELQNGKVASLSVVAEDYTTIVYFTGININNDSFSITSTVSNNDGQMINMININATLSNNTVTANMYLREDYITLANSTGSSTNQAMSQDAVTTALSNCVKLDSDASQTISLTSGTGTTPVTFKSKSATSCYLSYYASTVWVGSIGVSSAKKPVFYNGTAYTLACTSDIPTNVSELTNDSGFITGITSSDVTTALGYTPYNSSNPNGYTSNTGTITSVKMNGITISSSGEADLGTVITSHQDISGKEDKSNKVTSISSASTNDQYPTAKCVYDIVGDIETLLSQV